MQYNKRIMKYFLQKQYKQDLQRFPHHKTDGNQDILTEKDITHLPPPVQKYLHYTGSVGKPRVLSLHAKLEGNMRAKGKDYFTWTSEQYNFLTDPARLFYMTGRIKGLKVPGYHRYLSTTASMDIRLFGLISVFRNDNLFKAETVTFLNDMCFLAPGMLIDERIRWKYLNEYMVKASFTNKHVSISAVLYFNELGQLINFVSNDRTDVSDGTDYPWSTPIQEYREINGYTLAHRAEMIWHYPEEDFCYGKLVVREIRYNEINVR